MSVEQLCHHTLTRSHTPPPSLMWYHQIFALAPPAGSKTRALFKPPASVITRAFPERRNVTRDASRAIFSGTHHTRDDVTKLVPRGNNISNVHESSFNIFHRVFSKLNHLPKRRSFRRAAQNWRGVFFSSIFQKTTQNDFGRQRVKQWLWDLEGTPELKLGWASRVALVASRIFASRCVTLPPKVSQTPTTTHPPLLQCDA